MSGVNRYYAPGLDCMWRDPSIAPRECTPMVLASDYDRLKHECEQLRAFNLGLESEARRLFADYMAAEEKERDELRAQVEAMRKDADRYRWLRDEATPSWGCLVGDKDESAEQKDAEIDEAMRAGL